MKEESVISLLVLSRLFEEKIDKEFKEGNLYGTTHLSIGQEASHTGLTLALEEGDWFVPTHRCHGFNIASGSDIEAMFSEMLGSRYGLCKGLGGSMHMTDILHGNLGSSAVVGSGIPLALGASYALKRQGKGNIAVAVFGDGASSRGTLHEAMNLSSVWNLPVLFYMENNHYGMSAGEDRVIATSSIASRADGYRIQHVSVDGNDFDEVYNAVKDARKYILENSRPYFIEVNTYRMCGHSKSDKLVYRDREEEEKWRKKDPIKLYREKHSISEEELKRIIEKESAAVDSAWEKAWSRRDDTLDVEEIEGLVIPPSNEFESDDGADVHSATYREAVREALRDILSGDNSYSLIGEDIGKYGGCFGVTGDLYKEYSAQMKETPVSEETFTGMAVGASFLGERPIVEIMYGDFLTLASDPIINHGAKSYFMSAGQLKCPVIIRTAAGGGTGHGAQHTQSLENMFMNTPGLKIVAPSDARSVKALLKGAAKENCPVIFLEHKALYSDKADDVAGDGFVLPLGKAIITGKGKNALVIGYSRAFKRAKDLLDATQCTFLDIASLKPLDIDAIKEYGSKFSRALIVEDTPLEGSVAERVMSILYSANRNIKIKVVCGKNMPLPFSKKLEREVLVSDDAILSSFEELMKND